MIYDPDVASGASEALISSVDIVPTICDLLGVDTPLYVNGLSQKDHLMDPTLCIRDKCLLEYRNGYGTNDYASIVLITDRYKYVRYQDGVSELTDFKIDPEEKKNLAQDVAYKDLANKMSMELLDELLSKQQKHPKQLCLA